MRGSLRKQRRPIRSQANARFSKGPTSGHFDLGNRPEAIAQGKLQKIANQSPQVKQLRGFQTLANRSPQSHEAAQVQLMADKYSASLPVPEESKIPSEQITQSDSGLPGSLKSGVEQLSGYSMDDVTVHRNSNKPAQFQAEAYAQGKDIHLAPGQEKHLPHEAWHVAQQKQGRVKPAIQGRFKVNDDPRMEKEAESMGSKAAHLPPKFDLPKAQTGVGNHEVKQFKRTATKDIMTGFNYLGKEASITASASEEHYTKSLATGKKILDKIERSGESEESSLDDVQASESVDNRYKIGAYFHQVDDHGGTSDIDVGSTRNGKQLKKDMPYRNNYDDGVMSAQYNHKDEDSPESTAVPNSEIIWMQHLVVQKHCALNSIETSSELENIQRNQITNPQTRHTIWWCDHGHEASDYQEVTLSGNSDDFTALLGTPNGRSAGYLLVQHKDILGGTGIGSITYTTNSLEIVYE